MAVIESVYFDAPEIEKKADPNWQNRAACLGTHTDLFFAGKGGSQQIAKAKAICAQCPVTDECLDFALSSVPTMRHGVWGNTTERERRVIAKERGIKFEDEETPEEWD